MCLKAKGKEHPPPPPPPPQLRLLLAWAYPKAFLSVGGCCCWAFYSFIFTFLACRCRALCVCVCLRALIETLSSFAASGGTPLRCTLLLPPTPHTSPLFYLACNDYHTAQAQLEKKRNVFPPPVEYCLYSSFCGVNLFWLALWLAGEGPALHCGLSVPRFCLFILFTPLSPHLPLYRKEGTPTHTPPPFAKQHTQTWVASSRWP